MHHNIKVGAQVQVKVFFCVCMRACGITRTGLCVYVCISVSHVGLCMFSSVLMHACAHMSVRIRVSIGVMCGIVYVRMWLCTSARACVYACAHESVCTHV